jgi:hypothetical protein
MSPVNEGQSNWVFGEVLLFFAKARRDSKKTLTLHVILILWPNNITLFN